MTLLIAIDDTDNPDTIGTGRLARMLADRLLEEGLIGDLSVTRHQLLVHPQVPYTSHNSCACIAAETCHADRGRILDATVAFLHDNFHDGANPGLCIADQQAVSQRMIDFGRSAQQEVLTIAAAHRLSEQEDKVMVRWFGETGQGCIGAISGVALRSTGMDGRFIGLDGIRDLDGVMTVGQILANAAIHAVMSEQGERLSPDALVDTTGWVRPSLYDGRPVFFVTRKDEAWQPAEKRKKKAKS